MCTIITNNKPRWTFNGNELPLKVIADQFDYLSPDQISEHTFIKYRKEYYDLQEFMKLDRTDEFKAWDGYTCDSAWSGIVIKIVDDEQVIVGRYY